MGPGSIRATGRRSRGAPLEHPQPLRSGRWGGGESVSGQTSTLAHAPWPSMHYPAPDLLVSTGVQSLGGAQKMAMLLRFPSTFAGCVPFAQVPVSCLSSGWPSLPVPLEHRVLFHPNELFPQSRPGRISPFLAGFRLPREQGSALAIVSRGADHEGPQRDMDSVQQPGHLLEIDWVKRAKKPLVPSPGLEEPLHVPSQGPGEPQPFRLCFDVSSSAGMVLLPVCSVSSLV